MKVTIIEKRITQIEPNINKDKTWMHTYKGEADNDIDSKITTLSHQNLITTMFTVEVKRERVGGGQWNGEEDDRGQWRGSERKE